MYILRDREGLKQESNRIVAVSFERRNRSAKEGTLRMKERNVRVCHVCV
jgi:hypothetical protein